MYFCSWHLVSPSMRQMITLYNITQSYRSVYNILLTEVLKIYTLLSSTQGQFWHYFYVLMTSIISKRGVKATHIYLVTWLSPIWNAKLRYSFKHMPMLYTVISMAIFFKLFHVYSSMFLLKLFIYKKLNWDFWRKKRELSIYRALYFSQCLIVQWKR